MPMQWLPGWTSTGPGAAVQSDKSQKILVVDDEPDILEIVARYLRDEGFQVFEAADGNVAVTLALEERPDLIVLDLNLPGLHGSEVLRKVRVAYDVPIIMLTSRVDEVDRSWASRSALTITSVSRSAHGKSSRASRACYAGRDSCRRAAAQRRFGSGANGRASPDPADRRARDRPRCTRSAHQRRFRPVDADGVPPARCARVERGLGADPRSVARQDCRRLGRVRLHARPAHREPPAQDRARFRASQARRDGSRRRLQDAGRVAEKPERGNFLLCAVSLARLVLGKFRFDLVGDACE